MTYSSANFASVVLDVSVGKPLDYAIPEHLRGLVMAGTKVQVPLRGQLRDGVVLKLKDRPDFKNVKPIESAGNTLLTKDLFELSLWMASYYKSPLNRVLKTVLPATIRKDGKKKEQLFVMRNQTKEEIVTLLKSLRNTHSKQAAILDEMLQVKKEILLTELLEKAGTSRSPLDTLVKKGVLIAKPLQIDRSPLADAEYFQTLPKTLSNEQQAAFDAISKTLEENTFATHLLYGVTGSGKTEVYLQAIDKALAQGKGVIMLVPEISLTGQTIERFLSRFQNKIALLHHRLSDGERFDQWEAIKEGRAKIVVGARSAIFSPVKNLGLIIVDEEHEGSYKQSDDSPAYNARDVAVMRAKLTDGAVVLGSATPSLESFYNAKLGKYHLSTLHSRADSATMPEVTLVDMKKEYEKAGGYTNFSNALIEGIKTRVENGEQTILFLNRRGYHTMLFCLKCEKAVQCPHCDTSLTFHRNEKALSCHSCGYQLAPPPERCPTCGDPTPMKFKGVGTEQVERSLKAIFPEVRTLRLDADTTRHKGSHQKLLRQFGTGKADVLIGTQMIAKGLHFSEVTLVGVLNSDLSLTIPDFRSQEVTFQLLTQVAGRAGRGSVPGEVIIQTAMPDNPVIELASKQDYLDFYTEEIAIREFFGHPPFAKFVKITFSGKDQMEVMQAAKRFRSLVRLPNSYEIGPICPSGRAKVKDNYRFQLLIKGQNISTINTALPNHKPGNIKIFVDVNPLSTYF